MSAQDEKETGGVVGTEHNNTTTATTTDAHSTGSNSTAHSISDEATYNNKPKSESEKETATTTDVEKAGAEGEASPASPRDIHGVRWFLLILSSLCVAFLYALDNTIVANITPAIVDDFSSVDELPWLSVGFSIGGIATVLPIAKLYGMFDHRYVFIGWTVIFMAATALCGGAPNMNAEIVGRVFAGAGGTGMYIGVLTLISVHTNNVERPLYLSFIGLLWGAGTVLGPAIGGAVELATWRWGFYINLVAGGVVLPLFLWLVPHKSFMPGVPVKSKLKMFDWIGAVLSTAGFIFVIIPLNFGGTTFAWNSPTVIVLLVLGVVIWVAFFIQQHFEVYTSRLARVFPTHLFSHKETILASILTACGASCAFITVFYVPLYYQFVQGLTPLQTAVKLLPFVFMLITLVILGGAVLSKFGYYKPFYVLGSAITLVGAVLLSRIDETTSDSAIYGYTSLIGIGAGAYVQTTFAIVQVILPPEEAPNGVNVVLVAQLGGLSFALATAGAIFENLSLNGLSALLPQYSHAQIASVISGTGNVLQMLSPQERAEAIHIVVLSLQKVFTQVYATAAFSFVLSWFLSNKKVAVGVGAGGA